MFGKNNVLKAFYKGLIRPMLFSFDPLIVHEKFAELGGFFGRHKLTKSFLKSLFHYKNPSLGQNLFGIDFENPVGLAAGFDYDGNLTGVLAEMGFGFGTVGTITNMAYEGNPGVQLKRLIKSRSILVNKGFKNIGAHAMAQKLSGVRFGRPIGISIGRTNTSLLKSEKDSISDILSAFRVFEEAAVNHSYYELNISCPNLIHADDNVSFYKQKSLENLLRNIDELKIKRPIFVKMPISEDDKTVLDLLYVILRYDVKAVIFGNLQRDRGNETFVREEVEACGRGNFSGIPCRERSNELISLAFRHFGKNLKIVGCGGILSPYDAYEKIRRGASLLQMITGMIFEGPQVISTVNKGIVEHLKKDGFKSIQEAIGVGF
ncbi:dihydroorotate dehydrogenase (quinone) [Candidatus Peregrinibacteria bacterium]|nr:dihydroorotate dehydrogenase (quinone) [Candidatus Peregrinibacteria bacterium]